jgi:hypothetical protein
MSELVVPLKSIRQARTMVVQKLQDVVPALVLVGDGVSRVRGASEAWSFTLGGLEIVSGGLVVLAFVRMLKTVRRRPDQDETRHAHHSRVDWSDLVLGAMLVVEAVVHHDETGHWKRPTLFTAGIAFLFGLFPGRFERWVERRRSLHVTDDGIRILHPFRGFAAAWRDVTAFDLSDAEAVIATSAGKRRRIDLKDVTNLRDVRPVLEAAQTRWRETVRP